MDFLSDLGRRIAQSTDDHRESAFLFQRLNSTLQRSRCLGYIRPHTHTQLLFTSCFMPMHSPMTFPVPALVDRCCSSFSLVFSLQDLYYRGQKIIIPERH